MTGNASQGKTSSSTLASKGNTEVRHRRELARGGPEASENVTKRKGMELPSPTAPSRRPDTAGISITQPSKQQLKRMLLAIKLGKEWVPQGPQ